MKFLSILFVSLPALSITMASAIPEPIRLEIAISDDGNIDRSSQHNSIPHHADQHGTSRIAKVLGSSDDGEPLVLLPQSLPRHKSWFGLT